MQRLQSFPIARNSICILLYTTKKVFILHTVRVRGRAGRRSIRPALDFFVTFFVKKKSKEKIIYVLFALMQKEPKKSRQNECSAVLPAHAHAQSGKSINRYLMKGKDEDHVSCYSKQLEALSRRWHSLKL